MMKADIKGRARLTSNLHQADAGCRAWKQAGEQSRSASPDYAAVEIDLANGLVLSQLLHRDATDGARAGAGSRRNEQLERRLSIRRADAAAQSSLGGTSEKQSVLVLVLVMTTHEMAVESR